jgi:hypothetical protein
MRARCKNTPANHFHSYLRFSYNVLSILYPTPALLESARASTHLNLGNGPSVPLAYIQAILPVFHLYFDNESATHTLFLIDTNQRSREISVHDIILQSQCFRIRHVFELSNCSNEGHYKRVLIMHVPDIDSFEILLKWLYSNNKKELYANLSMQNDDVLLGFAKNCRDLGVVDQRAIHVVERLLTNRLVVMN